MDDACKHQAIWNLIIPKQSKTDPWSKTPSMTIAEKCTKRQQLCQTLWKEKHLKHKNCNTYFVWFSSLSLDFFLYNLQLVFVGVCLWFRQLALLQLLLQVSNLLAVAGHLILTVPGRFAQFRQFLWKEGKKRPKKDQQQKGNTSTSTINRKNWLQTTQNIVGLLFLSQQQTGSDSVQRVWACRKITV